jgi:integrase
MKTWKVKVRGENKYCVVVPTKQIDEFGKPKEKRFFHSKKHEAVAKAMDFLHNDLGSSVTIKSLKKITLEKVYDETWDSWNIKVLQKEKNPKKKNTITRDTMNRYEDYANALFKIVPRDTDIGLIDKKWVNDFIKKLHQTKSESQAYRIYSVFNMIMLKAEQLDYIEFSPTHAFKQDRPTYSSAGKKAIQPDEMKRILKEIYWSYNKYNSQSAFLLLIQAYTGARWGEIASLTVADIDFKNNKIFINKSKSSKTGKISLTKSGHLKQDEADMGERIVPIAPKFTNLINNYIENSTVEGDSLFNCSYTVSQDTFIAACKRAGSLQKETKIFRRFVSTQMRKLGASREEVKLRLGHSDDATQDIYVTHTDKNALNHAEKLFKTLN